MDLIEELMGSKGVHLAKDSKGNEFGIRVLGRGMDLFFKENNKGLICSIDAAHGVIYTKTIRIWDSTGEKISREERLRISRLIEKYYKEFYNSEVIMDGIVS
ncbi:hypothetical protein DBR43_00720 [Pedobacter sp. KBW06]|uniref:hypothetical protein n=1 Tax=Pedobacter sp. KBW06 TaxID=2153359 RepID=UPI000F593CBC|nr:hypothetical protein [Pedobacter sp. KBW06]RQO73963.1 hypothetical protein DBR43_00720 [Pedobacter sp. KBW06]